MASSIRTFTHYRNVVVLTFGNLVVMFGYSMFAPAMSIYLYSITAGSFFIIGLYNATFALSRSLLQPFTGRLSDKVGRKKLIVPALFSYSLVAFLYSTAGTPYEYIGYRAAQGVSSSTLWPASDALIADTVPTKERGRALGAVSMTYQVGTLIAPAIGGLIAALWGLKEVFYACALLSVTGAIASLLFLKEPGRLPKAQEIVKPALQNKESETGVLAANTARGEVSAEKQLEATARTGRRIIIFLAATSFLTMFTFSMIDVVLPLFINGYYGGSLLDIGLIYVAFGLAGALGAIIGGSLADKHGRRRIILVTVASGTVFWIVMVAVNTLMLLTVAISLFAFVGTMSGPAVSALIADLSPSRKRGGAFGILGMCNDLGMVAGPTLGGLLADYVQGSLGLGMVGAIVALFLMNAAITAIAAVLVAIGVREPKTKF